MQYINESLFRIVKFNNALRAFAYLLGSAGTSSSIATSAVEYAVRIFFMLLEWTIDYNIF
jgi:hypothetical protein